MSTSSAPKGSLSIDAHSKASIRVQLVGGGTAGLAECHAGRPDGELLRITGASAKQRPDGAEDVTGEVRGFVLSGVGVPTVYVSDDITQEPGTIPDAFARRGLTGRLLMLSPGENTTVPLTPAAQD